MLLLVWRGFGHTGLELSMEYVVNTVFIKMNGALELTLQGTLYYRNNKQTVRFLLPDINQFGIGKNQMPSIEVFNHYRLVYIR